MSYFAIKFPLPEPAYPVAQRELSVVINNQPAKTYLLPGAALVSDEMLFVSTDSYRVSLVDIDDRGNRSLPSKTFCRMVSDHMRPETPGAIGPILPAHARFLDDDQAEALRIQLDQKAAAQLKANDAKG